MTLPSPVRKVLRSGLDDLAASRMWRHMESRRASRVRVPRRLGAWAFGVGAVPLVAIVFVALTRATAPSGTLRLLGGIEISAMASASPVPRSFVFSDGSRIWLGAEGRLEMVENDGKAVVAILGPGSGRFDVKPGGPRRWTIECGLATVEVVGTSFTIDREPERLHVAVERGEVLVRGERVPERIQRLTPGQAIDVSGPMSEVLPPDNGSGSVSSHAPSPVADKFLASAPRSTWRDLAYRGDYASAYRVLGSDGLENVVKSGVVADLLTIADVARLSGHPTEALVPLRRIVFDHPHDPAAPVAAFTLGRVELDALADPANAADAFARAIALGVPQGLAEDAYVRLVEARSRAGDAVGARDAATQYTQRFPAGSRAATVRRWTGGP